MRSRYLADIPRYTDEVNEVQAAIDIARGRVYPLVSGTKHIGALFDYLLASAVIVFGRYPDLPRQLALVVGLLTVPAAYGYARFLGGPRAAAITALLLTVSATHILLSSRVAWSACLTPPLVVAASWAMEAGLNQRRSILLVIAALVLGLAFQAHPSVVAMLPGFGVFALVRDRRLLLRPATYLTLPAFALGCINVLVYNLRSASGSVGSVEHEYAGHGIGLSTYSSQLGAPADGLIRALGSSFEPVWTPTLMHVFALGVTAVSLWGLVRCARLRSGLPLLVTASAMSLLPLMNNDFSPLLKARYIMPLVPLAFVASGVALAGVLEGSRRAQARGRVVVTVTVVAVIISGSLFSLLQFENRAIAYDCTNGPQRTFTNTLRDLLQPGEWILLDSSALQASERLGYLELLEWSGARVGEVQLRHGGLRSELATRASFVTAVDDAIAHRLFNDEGYPLLASDVSPINLSPLRASAADVPGRNGIGLYRVTPEGARLLAYNPKPGCGDLATQ